MFTDSSKYNYLNPFKIFYLFFLNLKLEWVSSFNDYIKKLNGYSTNEVKGSVCF